MFLLLAAARGMFLQYVRRGLSRVIVVRNNGDIVSARDKRYRELREVDGASNLSDDEISRAQLLFLPMFASRFSPAVNAFAQEREYRVPGRKPPVTNGIIIVAPSPPPPLAPIFSRAGEPLDY